MSATNARPPRGRRAERVLETRRRIVEAAIALHEERGPARTTISAIAERAGVERLTVYRHFPDARSLLGACSERWMADNPPPDVASWARLPPRRRVPQALEELYAYYRRAEPMLVRLLQDRAVIPELAQLMTAFDETLRQALHVLAPRDGAPQRRRVTRASMEHALRFDTWQSLSAAGLRDGEAAELMARLVRAASRQAAAGSAPG